MNYLFLCPNDVQYATWREWITSWSSTRDFCLQEVTFIQWLLFSFPGFLISVFFSCLILLRMNTRILFLPKKLFDEMSYNRVISISSSFLSSWYEVGNNDLIWRKSRSNDSFWCLILAMHQYMKQVCLWERKKSKKIKWNESGGFWF